MIFITCHISSYFSHIPFISLQRTLFWEAFGFDRFFMFFNFLGELDGSGSCSLWFLRSAGYLQYPLNNFLKNEFGFELQILMRSCCNWKWRGDSDMTTREHTWTWCWIYLRCRIRNASILKKAKSALKNSKPLLQVQHCARWDIALFYIVSSESYNTAITAKKYCVNTACRNLSVRHSFIQRWNMPSDQS